MAEQGKGGVVAAIGMPHTPGLGNQLDRPDPAQVQRIVAGFKQAAGHITEANPDVIVAFVNDHFDMFTLRHMPGFAIALGETHWGPTPETEGWIQMQRGPIPGHADLARDICESVTADGFELYRADSAEFIHNVLLPKRYLWPDRNIPVVPIFINCFAPPLPTFRRAYELGRAVRKVLDRRAERVALIASGGISHWPPIVPQAGLDDELNERLTRLNTLGREAKDPMLHHAIMEAEKVMADSGRPLINVEWDRDFLQRLAAGDVEHLTGLDHDQVLEDAGPGGAEMLMWVALMGAMNAAPGEVLIYEAVKEWMGGVGLLSYPPAPAHSDAADRNRAA